MEKAQFDTKNYLPRPEYGPTGQERARRVVTGYCIIWRNRALEPMRLSALAGLEVMKARNNGDPTVTLKYGQYSTNAIDAIEPIWGNAYQRDQAKIDAGHWLLPETLDEKIATLALPANVLQDAMAVAQIGEGGGK